jgi:outer membrane protein assembly factor BamB
MRLLRLFVCLLLIFCSSAAMAAVGDWPMLRYDTALTGRTPAKGNITKPAIRDKLFAGAYEGQIVISPDGKAAPSVPLTVSTAGQQFMAQHGGEFSADGILGLVADDPRARMAESGQSRYAKLLPDISGLQKVEFESAFSGEPEQKGHLYAFDTPDGTPREVWKTEPEKDMYAPAILVLDADNDGLPEVAIATHYRVMIYNGQTGAKKMELRWHNGRNYGYFGSFTVPGDPYPKFVVIADFISHVDVLDNNGKKLSLLWRKEIEGTIVHKQKITRPGPNPIADIDGDGRTEITFNLYNDTGDGKWHVISYDALTGKTSFDLPDTYLHGIADVNGDSTPELFVSETHGLGVPRFSVIRLLSLKGGRQSVLWTQKQGCWQTTSLTHMPLTSATGAADGSRTVLLGKGKQGIQVFAVVQQSGNRQMLVTAAADSSGKFGVISRVTVPAGMDMQARSVRQGDVLVALRSPDDAGRQAMRCEGAAAQVVSWGPINGPSPVPICARLRPHEIPTLTFQNAAQQIVAMQKIKGSWRVRWRQAGRGVTFADPWWMGTTAADLNGDGAMETLFARVAKSGEAELVAVNPDGRQVWSHVFAGFDGTAPIWNIGGLCYWSVGHFTSKDYYDVIATVRRSTMHSDEGFCLSGKDGHVLWHKDGVMIPGSTDPEDIRGYGGGLLAAADVDGDGLDEIICEYPDRYWLASGKTGEVQHVQKTSMGIFGNIWVMYATPLVADFWGNGALQSLYGGSLYMTAMLKTDGEPIWYQPERLDSTPALQGVGNVEGTGKLYFGGDGYKEGFRCFDPVTGKAAWSYPLEVPPWPAPTPATPTITADVDGDGIQEFLFAHNQTLYALNGKDGKANLVWSLDLPVLPKFLAFADADGDGQPEIMFGANDGHVYTVGQEAK